MQAIDTTMSKDSNNSNTQFTLPSPPASPLNCRPQQPTTYSSNNRKRALSLSFIQNRDEPQSTLKKNKLDATCLEKYLKKKGSPNTCDQQFNRSLLSWACIGKSVQAVQELLSLVHLDINLISGPNYTTALHEACQAGFVEGVSLLVGHADIDLNLADKQGQTAVHYATQANHVECLKILLSAGARIDLFYNGKLPIHTAVQMGFYHCISLFVTKSKQHANNPTELDVLWTQNKITHQSSIESAIVTGYSPALQLLLDQDSAEKRLHLRQPGLVSLAVTWNRIECLQLLIKRGCVIDSNSLLNAVQQRKIDMVRELTLAGVKPCLANGQNPSFLYAANHGFMDMVPLVLTCNTSKDCIQQALLLSSCLGLHDQLAAIILKTLKPSVTKDTHSL